MKDSNELVRLDDGPPKDELVEALGTLGRRARPLDPSQLDLRPILDAPAVEAAVGVDAPDDLRAAKAVELIRQILADFPTRHAWPEIGTAMFAAEPEYLDKAITGDGGRKKQLLNSHGVTATQYDEQRPLIVRALAFRLRNSERRVGDTPNDLAARLLAHGKTTASDIYLSAVLFKRLAEAQIVLEQSSSFFPSGYRDAWRGLAALASAHGDFLLATLRCGSDTAFISTTPEAPAIAAWGAIGLALGPFNDLRMAAEMYAIHENANYVVPSYQDLPQATPPESRAEFLATYLDWWQDNLSSWDPDYPEVMTESLLEPLIVIAIHVTVLVGDLIPTTVSDAFSSYAANAQSEALAHDTLDHQRLLDLAVQLDDTYSHGLWHRPDRVSVWCRTKGIDVPSNW